MLLQCLQYLLILPLMLPTHTPPVCTSLHTEWHTTIQQAFITSAYRQALALDYDAAIASVNHALALYPDNPTLYTLRGELTLLLYAWDDALADFNQAITLDATYPPAYYHRAILYYTLTQRSLALADFETYLTLAPEGQFEQATRNYINTLRQEMEILGD